MDETVGGGGLGDTAHQPLNHSADSDPEFAEPHLPRAEARHTGRRADPSLAHNLRDYFAVGSRHIGDVGGLVQRKKKPLAAVAGGVCLLWLVLQLGASAGGQGPTTSNEATRLAEGLVLRQRIRQTSRAALAAGMLSPISTSYSTVNDHGMDFILSVVNADNQVVKDSRTNIAEDPVDHPGYDPFAREQRDTRMVVAGVPPEHVLLLNRFNTVQDHVLLVTDSFHPQSETLGLSDLTALFRLCEALPGIGFFNSAEEAGASQKHKHMQIVPLDVLQALRPGAPAALPVEEIIQKMVPPGSQEFWKIWRVPQFDFNHGFTLIPTREQLHVLKPDKTFYVHLEHTYHRLLDALGMHRRRLNTGEDGGGASEWGDLPPHNVLLTTRWIMVIPRLRNNYLGVEVNALGFVGALLAKDEAGQRVVQRFGALNILKGVTMP